MEEKRALGYICPACGQSVYGERTPFALHAAAVALVCTCGRSELTAQSDGETFQITVPCGVCGGEHRARVSARQVLQGEGVGLACPEKRQLCCYIGDIYRVRGALGDLELVVQKGKDGDEEPFVDSVVMYEVLSELRDMMQRGGIGCSCGEKQVSLSVHGAAVELECCGCGARLRLPAATDEDLDRLCCRYTLTIRGNR